MIELYDLKYRTPVKFILGSVGKKSLNRFNRHVRHMTHTFRVRRKEINGWVISTVFLPVDHSYDGGEPILFETVIFKPNGENDHMMRCGTHRRALKMHQDGIKIALAKGAAK